MILLLLLLLSGRAALLPCCHGTYLPHAPALRAAVMHQGVGRYCSTAVSTTCTLRRCAGAGWQSGETNGCQ
jgi:hypothetical protein